MAISQVTTTDDLIAMIPEWLTVGSLVEVDEIAISCDENYNGPTLGIVLSLIVIDINDLTTKEEIEEMIHYGEWLMCEILIDGQVIETDANMIYRIKKGKEHAENIA